MNAETEFDPGNDSITAKYQEIASAACARLTKNARVRRNLPGGGRLRMDRQLPFLCLYRGRSDDQDAGTRELITTEAAYLFASGERAHHAGLSHLCGRISVAMQEHFGMFLLIEVAARAMGSEQRSLGFEIHSSESEAIPSTINVLEKELESMVVAGSPAVVSIAAGPLQDASHLPRLDLSCSSSAGGGCCSLGLVVNPIYRDELTGEVFPMVLQSLRGKLATALRKTVAEFIGYRHQEVRTHYDTLGPSTLVRAARLIDQQLCEVSESFDFLLQVTPTNVQEAWEGFKESGYQRLPPLRYRHLYYHPTLLKRRLMAIEIERIEDPTLAYLFWEKQAELDRQLTALRDLHLPVIPTAEHPLLSSFLLSSLQLYGGVEDALFDLANEILSRFPSHRTRSHESGNERRHRSGDSTQELPSASVAACGVDAQEFVRLAHDEVDYYRARMVEFNATVEISDSIASGIMVSKDRLLVAHGISIPRTRVQPLLQHEIGTHLLTYFNGRCQPFRQLYAGLAGYEELQEGLAVLAEYLVGGLTSQRIRTLAARVLATHWMIHGKSFASVYAKLRHVHELTKRQCFATTLRVFRGGGLTKDVIYLRGLRDLLAYLASGHDIEPLYVGKIAMQHVPYIQELRRRGIIVPPRILPRFLDDENVRQRFESCRGKTVVDLMSPEH